MGSIQILTLWVQVDLGVMPMKEYSPFSKASGLEAHYQMQFSVISKTLVGAGVLILMQSVYATPSAKTSMLEYTDDLNKVT